MNQKDLLYSYMAGFIDGDGYVSIVSVSKNKQYVPKVAVTNCNKEIMNLFVEEFGGKVRKRIWKGIGKEKWKDSYEWSLTNQKCANVLNKLYPFIKLKKEQANLAIQAAQIKESTSSAEKRWHLDKYQEKQIALSLLKNRCLELNKRGK